MGQASEGRTAARREGIEGLACRKRRQAVLGRKSKRHPSMRCTCAANTPLQLSACCCPHLLPQVLRCIDNETIQPDELSDLKEDMDMYLVGWGAGGFGWVRGVFTITVKGMRAQQQHGRGRNVDADCPRRAVRAQCPRLDSPEPAPGRLLMRMHCITPRASQPFCCAYARTQGSEDGDDSGMDMTHVDDMYVMFQVRGCACGECGVWGVGWDCGGVNGWTALMG